ncbi:MAG: endonuclease/exonuclease/phosphatase family metal-dependent hydrolase [Mariniblastus sp.]|jgi:endonuclease/exonuclease/phosphatase family metal-dependent hydrolase
MGCKPSDICYDDCMNETPLKKHRVRKSLGWGSLLLAIAITVVHWFQFDSLAPVTMIPPWLWLMPGLILLGLSFTQLSRSILAASLTLWGLFAFLNVEEVHGLIRWPAYSLEVAALSDRFRVVSLNCNVGNRSAVAELESFQPDIVLLQESPSLDTLREVAHGFWGESANVAWAGDVSILVNGEFDPVLVDPNRHFSHGVATLNDGTRLDVVSLRLSPPVFRIDFLEAGFWNDHRARRIEHRNQLQEIVDYLVENQVTDNLVVGGDCNMVGGDGGFSPFQHLNDAFKQGGSGWCNTGTSEYPLFRVDQIWTTANLKCELLQAFKTRNSDHRMVVADFQIQP